MGTEGDRASERWEEDRQLRDVEERRREREADHTPTLDPSGPLASGGEFTTDDPIVVGE